MTKRELGNSVWICARAGARVERPPAMSCLVVVGLAAAVVGGRSIHSYCTTDAHAVCMVDSVPTYYVDTPPPSVAPSCVHCMSLGCTDANPASNSVCFPATKMCTVCGDTTFTAGATGSRISTGYDIKYANPLATRNFSGPCKPPPCEPSRPRFASPLCHRNFSGPCGPPRFLVTWAGGLCRPQVPASVRQRRHVWRWIASVSGTQRHPDLDADRGPDSTAGRRRSLAGHHAVHHQLFVLAVRSGGARRAGGHHRGTVPLSRVQPRAGEPHRAQPHHSVHLQLPPHRPGHPRHQLAGAPAHRGHCCGHRRRKVGRSCPRRHLSRPDTASHIDHVPTGYPLSQGASLRSPSLRSISLRESHGPADVCELASR